MNTTLEIPQRPERQFLPNDLKVTDWESIAPYVQQLEDAELDSPESLKDWLLNWSEFSAVVGEEVRWRYVRMSCDTTDKEAEEAVKQFYGTIEPKLKSANFRLNNKLVACPYTKELDQDTYFIYLRGIQNQIDLYREENLELFKDLSLKEKEYPAITGAMSIEHEGKEYTLQQAGNFLKDNDRELRETIYKKLRDRRLQDKEALDKLYDELIAMRTQVGKNTGFDNYRDYKHQAMGRFDYTPDDCMSFHTSVREEVVPVVNEIYEKRAQQLELETLKPWDLEVDPEGKEPLKPFDTIDEFINKNIEVLAAVYPYFGERLEIMNEMDYLDLESRFGKAPGGYNMTMPEIGVPFIFMNASLSDRDIRVMVHEAGHAVHTFLAHPLELSAFKSYPSEVAELASMSMELFTMDHWDVFYDNAEDLKRAKTNHLEGIFKTLPWVATVDKFQHWIYTHPEHTAGQRKAAWLVINKEFGTTTIDWTGNEEARAYQWQKQLHLYEVPFYYIEYGMAQLGALAMWRQYKQNPEKAIHNYMEALKLGYTRSISEIYETAGIEFRFDQEYIRELVAFTKAEYEAL